MKMQLNENSWHVRWFFFVQEKIWGSSWRYRDGTNLCHFIRVTMIWGPLWITFLTATALLAVAVLAVALFIGPYVEFGWIGLAAVWILIGGFAASFYWGLPFLVRHRSKFTPVGSALHTVGAYIVAAKSGVCPLVNFEEK